MNLNQPTSNQTIMLSHEMHKVECKIKDAQKAFKSLKKALCKFPDSIFELRHLSKEKAEKAYKMKISQETWDMIIKTRNYNQRIALNNALVELNDNLEDAAKSFAEIAQILTGVNKF